jgi:hypothetical protein
MDIIKIDSDFTPETHTVSNTSAQSNPIFTGSGIIRIAVTSGTHVKFGVNPTATVEDLLIPDNQVQYFSFKSGQVVAFIHHGGGSGEINICAID